MYFCDVNNRQTKELAPGVRTQTFWGEKVLISIVTIYPHLEVPNHSHPPE